MEGCVEKKMPNHLKFASTFGVDKRIKKFARTFSKAESASSDRHIAAEHPTKTKAGPATILFCFYIYKTDACNKWWLR